MSKKIHFLIKETPYEQDCGALLGIGRLFQNELSPDPSIP